MLNYTGGYFTWLALLVPANNKSVNSNQGLIYEHSYHIKKGANVLHIDAMH